MEDDLRARETPSSTALSSAQTEKTRLEIAALRRPWWQHPAFLATLAPTVLAVVALMLGVVTGYFDLEAKRLDLEKKTLAYDVRMFKAEKDSLEAQMRQIQAALSRSVEATTRFQATAESLEHRNSFLSSENARLTGIRDGLARDVALSRAKGVELVGLEGPIVRAASIGSAEGLGVARGIAVTISGFGFGDEVGRVYLRSTVLNYSESNGHVGFASVHCDGAPILPNEIEMWTSGLILISLDAQRLGDFQKGGTSGEIAAPRAGRSTERNVSGEMRYFEAMVQSTSGQHSPWAVVQGEMEPGDPGG